MKIGFGMLLLFTAASMAETTRPDLRLLDSAGTYPITFNRRSDSRGNDFFDYQASCLHAPKEIPLSTSCTVDGAPPGFGYCPTMRETYRERCYKRIYDMDGTETLVNKNLKAGLDTLTAAVKDSYRQIVTSEDLRRMVREEVRRALAEQAAGN